MTNAPPDPIQPPSGAIPRHMWTQVAALLARPVIGIGQYALDFVHALGEIVLFFGSILYWLPRRPFRLRLTLFFMRDIGFGSLFIVVITGFFTGLVFGLQTLQLLRRFQAESLVGPGTLITLARELGPVLTALMVAGRSGSQMATELGTMRVTEQIDALSTLAVSPVQYLVVPRVIAATLMLPLLVSMFTGCGYIGAYMIGVLREGVDPGVFMHETWASLDPPDFWEGYIKGAFFGLQIGVISCFKGFHTKGGARGVGQAATAAVVLSSVSILVGTYILTELIQPILYGYLYFSEIPK